MFIETGCRRPNYGWRNIDENTKINFDSRLLNLNSIETLHISQLVKIDTETISAESIVASVLLAKTSSGETFILASKFKDRDSSGKDISSTEKLYVATLSLDTYMHLVKSFMCKPSVCTTSVIRMGELLSIVSFNDKYSVSYQHLCSDIDCAELALTTYLASTDDIEAIKLSNMRDLRHSIQNTRIRTIKFLREVNDSYQ